MENHMTKMFLLATTFAAFMAGAALPSQAQTYGGMSPYPEYGGAYSHRHHHRERISCWEGRREVRNAGFRDVRTIRCSDESDTYRYIGRRGDRSFTIRVDAYSGDIVSVRPLRYY
jgi:hypothetical protein